VGETYAELAAHYGLFLDAQATHVRFKEALADSALLAPRTAPQDTGDRAFWHSVVERAVGPEVPAEFSLSDFFEEVYTAFARPDVWRVFPEAPEVLQALKDRGCRLAIISNWDSRLRDILAGLELAEYFESIWISAELGMQKPQPEIFHHAAAQAGNIPPADCWMIGDDQANDVDAPRALGWNAVWVERPRVTLEAVALRLMGD